MTRIILAPDECIGCHSLNYWEECRESPGNKKDIPDCPCKTCLVKITCNIKIKNSCSIFSSSKSKVWEQCFIKEPHYIY